MIRLLSFAFGVFLLLASSAFSQESAPPPNEGESTEGEKDWLEFYYENPTPGRLVAEVKQWAKDGTLDNEAARPAIIAFLSQVFRQNRGEIAGWYGQLRNLKSEHLQIIHTAMLYSRASEADNVLRPRIGVEYDQYKLKLPKILEMNLAERNTFDMLWGFFYATGSENAIRRIIWGFRFDAAPDNPDFAKIPKDHQPLYTVVPDAAEQMLRANMKRHPKVVELCEKIYDEGKGLTAPEKRRLRGLLLEINPEKYRTKGEAKPKKQA